MICLLFYGLLRRKNESHWIGCHENEKLLLDRGMILFEKALLSFKSNFSFEVFPIEIIESGLALSISFNSLNLRSSRFPW